MSKSAFTRGYNAFSGVQIGVPALLDIKNYYTPGTIEAEIQAYLEDKLVEYKLTALNHLYMTAKKRRYDRFEVYLYKVPSKMLRKVLLPEIKRISSKHGRFARPSYTMRKRGIIKKIKIRI